MLNQKIRSIKQVLIKMLGESIYDDNITIINLRYIALQVDDAKIELRKDKVDKAKINKLLNNIKEELGYKVD